MLALPGAAVALTGAQTMAGLGGGSGRDNGSGAGGGVDARPRRARQPQSHQRRSCRQMSAGGKGKGRRGGAGGVPLPATTVAVAARAARGARGKVRRRRQCAARRRAGWVLRGEVRAPKAAPPVARRRRPFPPRRGIGRPGMPLRLARMVLWGRGWGRPLKRGNPATEPGPTTPPLRHSGAWGGGSPATWPRRKQAPVHPLFWATAVCA